MHMMYLKVTSQAIYEYQKDFILEENGYADRFSAYLSIPASNRGLSSADDMQSLQLSSATQHITVKV